MRKLIAVLGAAFAVFGFAACLFGLMYIVGTKPCEVGEPAAQATNKKGG